MNKKQFKDKELRKLDVEYGNAKLLLLQSKTNFILELDSNPFIRRKWGMIDKMFFKLTAGFIPPTPYEEHLEEINKIYRHNLEQLQTNYIQKRRLIMDF